MKLENKKWIEVERGSNWRTLFASIMPVKGLLTQEAEKEIYQCEGTFYLNYIYETLNKCIF